jgi:hypothetical protein
MKIRLARKAQGTEQIIYDLSSHKVEIHTVENKESAILNFPLKGCYDILEGKVLALYKRDNEKLELLIGKQQVPIDAIEDVLFEKKVKTNILSIITLQGSVTFEYDTSNLFQVTTLTYSEEEEDVNFGLWLFNILKSRERQNILLDNW